MKKLLYLVFAIFVVAFISCGQKSNKQQVTTHASVHKIQDTFFGLKLGETTLEMARNTLYDNGYKGEINHGDTGDVFLQVYGPVIFGKVKWEEATFIFASNNIFKGVLFQIFQDSEHYTEEQKEEIFSNLHEQLAKKYDMIYYPADSTSGECYRATQPNYEMDLVNDNGTITLGYGINPELVDKVNNGGL